MFFKILNHLIFSADNLPQVEENVEETASSNDFILFNDEEVKEEDHHEEQQPEIVVNTIEEVEENVNGGELCEEEEVDEMSIGLVNGQFVERSHNGAEAYENLVKSLTECDTDYIKGIPESESENSFNLIDGNMLETISYSRESEGLFQ